MNAVSYCHPVTPPISKHCHVFQLGKPATTATTNIKNLRNGVTGLLTVQDDNTIETTTQVLFESLHNPSNSGSNVSPSSICLCHACSRNVLK